MIFGLVGGVGSGKSVTATKKAVNSDFFSFVNFAIKSGNTGRIMKQDVIKENIIGNKKDGTPIKELKINWEFWENARKQLGDFNIFLDEMHNLFHSRMAMTKWNTLGTQWISQIRKLLGSSEVCHIYCVSQRLERIDTAFRDLMHGCIYCRKVVNNNNLLKTKVRENGKSVIKSLPAVWVYNFHFIGDDCVQNCDNYIHTGKKCYDFRTVFLANPYFQFYDSYEVFGDTPYL